MREPYVNKVTSLYDIHTIIVIRLMTMISSSFKKKFFEIFFFGGLVFERGGRQTEGITF